MVFVAGGGPTGPVPVAERLTRARDAKGLFISWREHIIDDQKSAGGLQLRGADGLQMDDLDKDGYMDIVSVHEDSNHIRVAYGSKDPNNWVSVSMAEGDEAGEVGDVAIGDLNGDGYPDVIAACERGHLLYLQNPGSRTPGRTVRGSR